MDSTQIVKWQCTDRDEVAEAITRAFPKARGLALPCRPTAFYYHQTILKVGSLFLARYDNSGVKFGGISPATVHLGFAMTGSATISSGRGEISTRPFHRGNTIPPLERFDVSVTPRTVSLTIDASVDAFRERTIELLGRPHEVAGEASSVDMNCGIGDTMMRNMVSAIAELERLEVLALSPLATSCFEDLLLSLLVVTLFPKDEGRWRGADPGKSVVDNARLYIEALAGEPLKISEIAREMGVSLRSLESGFRKRFGCSPLNYLLARRVELARARLLAPAVHETVTSIATDCGFLNLGLFARRYRNRYGELPSQTLTRARLRR